MKIYREKPQTTQLLTSAQAIEQLCQVYTESSARFMLMHRRFPITYYQQHKGGKLLFSALEIADLINEKLCRNE